jgi:hypothetical protein
VVFAAIVAAGSLGADFIEELRGDTGAIATIVAGDDAA